MNDPKHVREYQLAILLSMRSFNEEDMKKIRVLLIHGIDWGGFLHICTQNKIVCLVYHNIINLNIQYIDPFVMTIFKYYKGYVIQKVINFQSTIIKINENFLKNNIKYAIVKGYDLLARIYEGEKIYIRDFNDIDILVNLDQIEQVKQILTQLGFVQGRFNVYKNDIDLPSRQDVIKYKMQSHQIYNFTKKQYVCNEEYDAINIDVNYTIFDGGLYKPQIPTQEILNRRKEYKTNTGITYFCLDVYDGFIQLVYHLYKETNVTWMQKSKIDLTIQKFCDIREYILWSDSKWDESKLIEYISEHNLCKEVYFVLYYTNRLFQLQLLKNVMSAIKEEINQYDDFLQHYNNYFNEHFALLEGI